MKTKLMFAAMLSLSLHAGLAAAAQAASASSAAPAAPTADARANRFAATIAPAERFEVKGVLVERHGGAGRPLILIPGLASGSWAWQDLIRALGGEYTLYVLTLPGFDGRPAGPDAGFANARAALAQLIAERRLDKPVIIGHSLGGTLGLALAEDQPASVGGVATIDGLPVMPGTETLPPMARSQYADTMRMRVGNQAPAQFAAQQQGYMRTIGVLDMDKADDLARLTGRSEPAAVGRYAADVLMLDLRPGLASIQAPVLAIAPYFDADAAQQGIGEQQKADYYRELLNGTPRLQVVTVAPARHFAMIDAPGQVEQALRSWLKTL